jgi:hypothetical protein
VTGYANKMITCEVNMNHELDSLLESLKIDYLRAMVSLYGVISFEKALDIINGQNDLELTIDDFIDLDLSQTSVTIEQGYFAHEALFIDDSMDQLLTDQGDKPYFIPSREALLQYSRDFYYERPPAFDELQTYMMQAFTIDDHKAEGICEDLQIAFSMGDFSLQSSLREIQRRRIKFTSDDQVNQLVRRITNLYNQTRNWKNRGFTPDELFNLFDKLT